MKILFISDLYPVKESEKRTPRTLSNFVSDWKNDGHEVDVIKPNFMLNAFVRKKPIYKQGNYNGVMNLNFWTPFWGEIKPPAKQYDVVIAHMPSGILYADKINLPFVAGIHNSDLTVLTNPLYKFHFKKRMEKALENAFLEKQMIDYKQYEIPRICTQTKSIQSEKKHKIQYKLFGCIPLIEIKSNERKQKTKYKLFNKLTLMTIKRMEE